MEIRKQIITNHKHMEEMQAAYNSHPPKAAAFDTEGSGLSIIDDKPFLFQFGWYDGETIFTHAIDLENVPEARQFINHWHDLVKSAPVYLAHNIKFDLHMLANIGLDYNHNNISDTQFYIRFAHDNVSARQGGIKLGLKDYCKKYIDPAAASHDKKIQLARSQIAKAHNTDLKKHLGWTLKKVDAFFGDSTNDTTDFPDIQDYLKYMQWHETLPPELKHVTGKVTNNDIPYNMVDRDLVIEYGLYDIVWALLVYDQTAPVVQARDTTLGLEIENKSIRPLYDMERVGLDIDYTYVNKAYSDMRLYIRKRRQDLKDLMGMDVTANQNKVILEFLQNTGINIKSTGNEILDRVHVDYPDHPSLEVVNLVQELRTLEKWLSTYLVRFKDKSRIHTQFNQVGAASLRMSSDFQQFPKSGISDKDGNELFNPRRAIKAPKGFNIVYIDYSQIELRVQALYTILVGKPDINLCRAYMPYKCRSDVGLFDFDYMLPDHVKHWDTGEWVQLEDLKKWIPVDVHGATTKAAFSIDETHPDFHDLRYLGKRVNFAKNYGAQQGQIAKMFPDYDEATIKAIDEGYYKAFPGIRNYQTYCYELARCQPYATNLFGVKYWNVSGHNLINMLIQGSSATLLKLKINEMHKYLKDNNCESYMIMPVHDEVQFAIPDHELHIVPELKAIMEDWESYVPVVADTEITKTYWSEKEEYDWKKELTHIS